MTAFLWCIVFIAGGQKTHQNRFFFAFIANVFLMWSFCLILMGSTSRYKHIQNSFMHTLILRVWILFWQPKQHYLGYICYMCSNQYAIPLRIH